MKKIVFVMSDTGHGHRAAAKAVSTALTLRYGSAVDCQIVDVFKHYTPFPFRNFPEYYPSIVKHGGRLYDLSFKLSDTPRRTRLLSSMLATVSHSYLRRLPADYPADAMISTHSIITRPSFGAVSRMANRPLLFTLVVDLISAHTFWYDNRADVLLLPTRQAYEAGLKAGVQPDKMHIVGMPVHPDFAQVSRNKRALRQRLGWEVDMPTVLLTGGGDGMGRLHQIATHINESRLPLQLVIITGHNSALKQALDAIHWHHPVRIYGFVNNMYELMAASDLLITKAGSLTLSEACVVGLPMLMYEALPGQEEGNLEYIVEGQAGLYAPSNKTIVRRLRELVLDDRHRLGNYALNARRLGRPDAVWQIAEMIWQRLHD